MHSTETHSFETTDQLEKWWRNSFLTRLIAKSIRDLSSYSDCQTLGNSQEANKGDDSPTGALRSMAQLI